MTKMIRRWMAGLLSGLMVLTSGSFTALAEETVATVQAVEDSAVTDAESVVTATDDTASADEDVTVLYSGVSGDLDWEITSDGILTISGDGNYEYADWKRYKEYFTKAVVNVTGITNMSQMFFTCDNITSIDLSNIDTSNVTDMSGMFANCSGLSELDVSSFDTSNVTDMSGMFDSCVGLETLDVSNFDTSNVTDMTNMFAWCEGLTELDISNFDTSNVTVMTGMFRDCWNLTTLDLSNFDTSNVTSLCLMFWMCRSLENVDLSSFDTSRVTNAEYMFYECNSLENLNLSNFDMSNVTSNMGYFFYECTSLTSLALPVNLTASIDLPDVFGYYWADEDGNVYTEVPAGLSASITLTRNETVMDLADAVISLTAEAASYTYDGTAKEPAVTVRYDGTKLTEGTDYTVSYSDNVNAGTAIITVTGMGYYSGTGTRTFTIKKAEQTVTASQTSVSVSAGNTVSVTAETTGDGSFTWKTSDKSVATVSDGVITGKAVGTATVTVKAAATDNYKSATTTITVTVKPAATTISSISNTTSGVKLTWSEVAGATKYYVYRKAGSSGSWEKYKTISSGSTVTCTDTTVSSGTTYYYKVYAYASTGTSSASSAKSIRRLSSAKISSLTNTSSGITVKWGKVTGASGYYVYRKASGGSYSLVKTITSGSTVSYTDTVVKSKNGTTYIYKVLPYYKNSSGKVTKGSYANTKTTVRLTAISISSLTNSSSKKMTVKWAKNSKATGYQIQYSTSSSFTSGNKTVTVTSASTVSKVISSLTKGKTYYVRVRAYKTVSGTKYYSTWSSKKSVKISK